VAIAVMLAWLFNFVVVMITPIGLKTLNYKFYVIWAVTDLAFVFIVYAFYPETARKSLEEIDLLFLKEPEKETQKEDEKVEGQ
jgi:hypothetical protein